MSSPGSMGTGLHYLCIPFFPYLARLSPIGRTTSYMTKNTLFSYLRVMALFQLAALLLRWPSFFLSVIDHDESTYIVIADAIRAGKMYLVDVIDNKPIGIFLLFGFFQKVLGTSIIMIRLATSVWIGLTAFLLYLSHKRLRSPDEVAWSTGLIYVFVSSIYTMIGMSPNTEQFFNLFTVASLLLLLPRPRPASAFAAGLLMGLGFLIKYVVVFEAMAFAAYFVWTNRKEGAVYLTKIGLTAIAGFVLPILAVGLYYHRAGQLDALWYYTFELSYKYVSHRSAGSALAFAGEMAFRFLPVSFWFFHALSRRSVADVSVKLLGGLWALLAALSVLLHGKMHTHLFIQFMPPLAFLAGCYFDNRMPHGRFWTYWLRLRTGGVLVAALAVVNVAINVKQLTFKHDYPKEVADWLKPQLKPGELVYTANYQQVIYHLLDRPSPTPYVHSTLLTYSKHLNTQGIDHNTEMKKILDQQPAYIIIKKNYPVPNSILLDTVNQVYNLEKIFGNDIKVYRREY